MKLLIFRGMLYSGFGEPGNERGMSKATQRAADRIPQSMHVLALANIVGKRIVPTLFSGTAIIFIAIVAKYSCNGDNNLYYKPYNYPAVSPPEVFSTHTWTCAAVKHRPFM